MLATSCTGGDGGGAGRGGGAVPGGTGNEEVEPAEVERRTAEEVPLEVGQCADVPRVRVGAPIDPATMATVPCDQPHTVEVAAVFDHPAGAGVDFPGVAAVDGYATDQCLLRFEDYVGTPYEASVLDVAFVAPGEDGWDDGDRRIACVLYHLDFEPLTGSVRGTGR